MKADCLETPALRKREAFQMLKDELESSQLCVILVPAPEPQHYCHYVRAKIDENPRWYRQICERFPSTRKGKTRTKIKRREVLRVLGLLAKGRKTESYLLPYLETAAESVLERYAY